MTRIAGRPIAALLGLGLAFGPVLGVARAAPFAATLDDPHVVPENPFALAGTTVGADAAIDRYDCAPEADESGGEVVYQLEVPLAGKVSAWVEGDDGAVDVDVHVVVNPVLEGTLLSGCLARGNAIAEADVPAGSVFVIVDTFGGAASAGSFVLHTTWIGDAWTESEPFEGVVWRAKRYVDYAGGPQVVHELIVDLANPAVRVEAHQASGCQTIDAMARELGAAAAINGGYFAAGCAPVSLLQHQGELLGTNAVARSAFGVTSEGEGRVERVAVGASWPEVQEAHGGGPRLVLSGEALTSNDGYAEEGITAAGFIGPNPRTMAGVRADGRIAFAGVDGRRPTAAGMSLPALATWAVALGWVDAVNLDGGGSTTVHVSGATPSGVVNYPSDAGAVESSAHGGARAVSGGLFVFSEPKAHAPVFVSDPPLAAAVGAAYRYDAYAYDRNPEDQVRYAIDDGPEGMVLDEATGRLDWLVPEGTPDAVSVVLVATDGSEATAQTFVLTVEGGSEASSSASTATTGAAAGGGDGGPATAGAGGSSSAGTTPAGGGYRAGGDDADDGGCGCRLATGSREPAPRWLLACAMALVGALARRGRPGASR